MVTIEDIRALLAKELDATTVDITDNSWQHRGHMGYVEENVPTHLAVRIESPKFAGLGIMDQHRLVHAALKPYMGNPIHALELKTSS